AAAGQRIWPYTDLLVHDMGDALADGRPDFAASGAQWRTPPLWGVGLIRDVNGHQRLMHDGRADGTLQAILWHGGEAAASRDHVLRMSRAEREALIAFVDSL
ncbi:MAG: thiol oxidoreductase, partial [Rhodoferax sp.]|nr:thiol oxidoreductase [Rhodoferax sp.]